MLRRRAPRLMCRVGSHAATVESGPNRPLSGSQRSANGRRGRSHAAHTAGTPGSRTRPVTGDTNVTMLEFRILGPLEVGSRVGSALARRPEAARAPRALLIRANEVVSTDRLIEDLWGESPAADGGDVAPELRLAAPQGPRAGAARHAAARVRARGRSARRSTLARFERLLRDARERASAERACEPAREALALWRGRAARGLRLRAVRAERDRAARGAAPGRARGADRRGARAGPTRGARRRARGARRASIRCASGFAGS